MMTKSTNGYFDKNVKVTSFVNFGYDKDARVDLDTDDDKKQVKKVSSSSANLDLLLKEENQTTSTSNDNDLNSTVKDDQKRFAFSGVLYAMASSVFFTLTAVIVKYLKDIHPGQTAVFRFLGIFLFTIPILFTSGENPFGPRDKRIFLIARGIAGATSLYLRYSALHILPIANATIIVLSMPVFVCLFARIFLKEPCGIFHVVTIGVTLLGIGFTSKIDVLVGFTASTDADKQKDMWGLGYSMAATLVGSAAYILVRKVKDVHSSVILINFSVVAIVETSIITAALNGFKMPDCGIAPWLLVALAVLSFYAQMLLTRALQIEEASIVSVTRSSSEVVCAFIFQILFFKRVPEWTAIVGAVLVSSSVVLTTTRKWVLGLPDGHWATKWLGFTTK